MKLNKNEIYRLVEHEVRKGLINALTESEDVNYDIKDLRHRASSIKSLQNMNPLHPYTDEEKKQNFSAILGDNGLYNEFQRNPSYAKTLISSELNRKRLGQKTVRNWREGELEELAKEFGITEGKHVKKITEEQLNRIVEDALNKMKK